MAKKVITAKVTCTTKGVAADGQSATLAFSAHYADEDGKPINEAWSYATPHLGVNMTVRAEVAESFEQGAHYTLAFTPDAE